jgi:hypothetical protein
MDLAPSYGVEDFRESCSLGYNSEFLYTNTPPLPAFLRSCVVVGGILAALLLLLLCCAVVVPVVLLLLLPPCCGCGCGELLLLPVVAPSLPVVFLLSSCCLPVVGCC